MLHISLVETWVQIMVKLTLLPNSETKHGLFMASLKKLERIMNLLVSVIRSWFLVAQQMKPRKLKFLNKKLGLKSSLFFETKIDISFVKDIKIILLLQNLKLDIKSCYRNIWSRKSCHQSHRSQCHNWWFQSWNWHLCCSNRFLCKTKIMRYYRLQKSRIHWTFNNREKIVLF